MSTTRVQEYLSTIPVVTKVLLLVNCCVHAAIFFTSFPVNLVSINPMMIILRGEYYRLVSSAFVHGGILHIAMNMSTLLAIGAALETKYGSVKMLFLTLWALVLSGAMFVALIWVYAGATNQPGELNTSAVGYSGVLFCYALIEAFHSVETSRSVFGMFSVPTKAYPFILLVLIQVIMPNISWWGHLSGLLVGVILISRTGVDLFMPSSECMAYLDQSSCCRPLALLGGYVPDRDRDLVHPYLDCGGGGVAGSVSGLLTAVCTAVAWVASYVCAALLFVWHLLSAVLTIAGVPSSALSGVEGACAGTRQRALGLADALWALLCQCQCQCRCADLDLCACLRGPLHGVPAGQQQQPRTSRGQWWSNGYSPIATQEPDIEAAAPTIATGAPAPAAAPSAAALPSARPSANAKGANKQEAATIFV